MKHLQTVSAAAFACGALLAVGCAHKDDISIAGKWSGQAQASRGGATTMSVEFKPDGTDAWSVTTPRGSAGTTGTYAVAGNTLTDKPSAIMFNGQTMPMPASSRSDVFTVKVAGDTLTLDHQTSPDHLVFTRQK